MGKQANGSFIAGFLDHGQHSAHPLPAVVPRPPSDLKSDQCSLFITMGGPFVERHPVMEEVHESSLVTPLFLPSG